MKGESMHLDIGGRRVGPGEPVYIVAEMSANHNGDYRQAVDIMQAARDAGADAVKIQTYTPDTMTIAHGGDGFTIGKGTIWEGRNLYDLYKEAYTPWEWQEGLRNEAARMGIGFFSTAFDETAVDFLEKLDVPVHKVASFEIVDLPLIRKMASTGKPLIMSTGMSTEAEIREAMETARGAGARDILLLKCTSAYPAPHSEMNLRTIPSLSAAFGVPAGLSDHTLGHTVAVAAVALGACMVEKHFTLSRSIKGPDSEFSMEPAEFAEMVRGIRMAEAALGAVRYGTGNAEESSKVFRRSLYVVADVKAGEPFHEGNVRAIRPGFGMHTRHLASVLGKRASRDLAKGMPLDWDMIAPG
jgi:N-acetylneuraminate synthase